MTEPTTERSGWKFDARSEITPEDHPQGEACHPLLPHSHRNGSIKWARPFPSEPEAARRRGTQCAGYVGDPGASAPRCESYEGHPGRHFIRPARAVRAAVEARDRDLRAALRDALPRAINFRIPLALPVDSPTWDIIADELVASLDAG